MNYICYSSYFRSESGGKDTKLFRFRQDISLYMVKLCFFGTVRLFSYLWGRNDPFISRKVLPNRTAFSFGLIRLFHIFEIVNDPFISREVLSNRTQFGFGTIRLFRTFGVVTTLLSVGRFCRTARHSVLNSSNFFISLWDILSRAMKTIFIFLLSLLLLGCWTLLRTGWRRLTAK